jgi:hypothetical integral membrane protein (TIGR02206 family)
VVQFQEIQVEGGAMQSEAGFHLWGTDHLYVLLLTCALGFLVAWLSRQLEGARRNWVSRILGFSLVAYVIAVYATLFATGTFDPHWSLPLELCHWVLILTAFALFTKNRLATEIAYFWGVGGTLQALLTPDLLGAFPSWDFIFFFWGHAATLLGIVFLISAKGFRLAPGSIACVFLALNAYGAFVGAIDAVTGWNYGYLRQKPPHASLLDYLGSWPWYLLSLEVFALAMFVLLALPWKDRNGR